MPKTLQTLGVKTALTYYILMEFLVLATKRHANQDLHDVSWSTYVDSFFMNWIPTQPSNFSQALTIDTLMYPKFVGGICCDNIYETTPSILLIFNLTSLS